MATRIQLRRDTRAAWVAANPVLAQGEAALIIGETPMMLVVGDGSTAFNSLPEATLDPSAAFAQAEAGADLSRALAYDTFVRADGALGTSDSGDVWSVLAGAVTIVGNKAVTDASTPSLAVVPAGTVSAQLSVTGASTGATARLGVCWAVDANNLLEATVRPSTGSIRIAKIVAGTFTTLVEALSVNGPERLAIRLHAAVVDTGASLIVVAWTDHGNAPLTTTVTTDYAALAAATNVGLVSGNKATKFSDFMARESQ